MNIYFWIRTNEQLNFVAGKHRDDCNDYVKFNPRIIDQLLVYCILYSHNKYLVTKA